MELSKLEVITMKKRVFLDYDERETVMHLKHMIYLDSDIRVRPAKQRIYYFGNLLEDHKTLGMYNINPDKYVLVMIHDTKTNEDNKISLRKTKTVHRIVQEQEKAKKIVTTGEIDNALPLVPRSISDYDLRNLIASKLGRSLNLPEIRKLPIEEYFSDYCTFEGYKKDPLFLNLVKSMYQQSDSTVLIEEAVQKLVESNSKVLDLIYENLEEFLSLCLEPEKIGDTI